MNEFYFSGAKVVLPNIVLNEASVRVKNGKIVEITDKIVSYDLPVIDLTIIARISCAPEVNGVMEMAKT